MDRYNNGAGSDSAPSTPDAAENPFFTAGNPGTGVPATVPGPWWFHMITEELRKVIVDGGLTPDHTDLTQLSDAIQAMIANSAINIPSGQVDYFAMNTAPTGYLKANGAAVSRTTYADLFAAIGTTFGAGDGSTTFNLPDLRGEFLRGWDDSRGVDSGRIFGSAQLDALQNMTGGATVRGSTSTINATGVFSSVADANAVYAGASAGAEQRLTFNASLTARTSTETRPRNIALLACIKF